MNSYLEWKKGAKIKISHDSFLTPHFKAIRQMASCDKKSTENMRIKGGCQIKVACLKYFDQAWTFDVFILLVMGINTTKGHSICIQVKI